MRERGRERRDDRQGQMEGHCHIPASLVSGVSEPLSVRNLSTSSEMGPLCLGYWRQCIYQ